MNNLLNDYVLLPASPSLKEIHTAITKRQTIAANQLRKEWPLGALVEFTCPSNNSSSDLTFLGVIKKYKSWKSIIVEVQACDEIVYSEAKRYEIQLTPAVHPQLRRYTKRVIDIPQEHAKWID